MPASQAGKMAGARGVWIGVGVMVLAAAGGLAWFLKSAAKPPPPPVVVEKKRVTLKDWEDGVPPSRFVGAMDAFKRLSAKAGSMPLDPRTEAYNDVIQAANHTEARVMLLSALQGQQGPAAAGILSLLARKLFAYQHHGDLEELGLLQGLTIQAVLPYAHDPADEVRHGAAACLALLASPLVDPTNGKRLWELDAAQKRTFRAAAERYRQDSKEEIRLCSDRLLKNLDGK
jgi:hypothetical protein